MNLRVLLLLTLHWTLVQRVSLSKITATVELGSNHSKADADKMMAHELGEIADIVAQVEARKKQDALDGKTTSQKGLQDLADSQQQASVFKPGGSNDPKDMTAHDRAAMKEAGALIKEISKATDPKAIQAAREKLARLGESMGINDIADPKLKMLDTEIGPLNGEQIAGIVGLPPAPDGYQWTGNIDSGITVQNKPGNSKDVLVYNPATKTFDVKPGEKPIDHHAEKSKDPFAVADANSEMNNRKGYQEAAISRSDVEKTPLELEPNRQKDFDKIKQRLDDMGITHDFDPSKGPREAGEILDNLESARKKAQAYRDGFPEGSPDYKKGQQAVVEISEQIGEISARAAIEGKLPDAKRLTSDTPGGKQGQFDMVYEHIGPDGEVYIYILESKGGDAGLGTRTVKDPVTGIEKVVQQGSPEYRDAILAEMRQKAVDTNDAELLRTVIKIETAKEDGTLSYMQVSQKIDSNGDVAPDVLFSKFENDRNGG